MKTSNFYNLILAAFLALSVSSCSVVGGIFKMGMGVGVFIVVTVVVFIVVLILRSRNRNT